MYGLTAANHAIMAEAKVSSVVSRLSQALNHYPSFDLLHPRVSYYTTYLTTFIVSREHPEYLQQVSKTTVQSTQSPHSRFFLTRIGLVSRYRCDTLAMKRSTVSFPFCPVASLYLAYSI